jgi:hypothetical protein
MCCRGRRGGNYVLAQLGVQGKLDVEMSTVVVAALVVWWLACWPLVPKIAGSDRAEAVGFFRLKNPQHAFLRRGSKAVCPMSQICGM